MDFVIPAKILDVRTGLKPQNKKFYFKAYYAVVEYETPTGQVQRSSIQVAKSHRKNDIINVSYNPMTNDVSLASRQDMSVYKFLIAFGVIVIIASICSLIR
jgi:hypothetical protein